MVRQDKISYLITGFTSTRMEPICPDEPLIDLLVRTILSQGTKDELRDSAMENIKLKFSNWDDILHLKTSELENMINICGLANKKTNSIFNLLKWIKSTFNEMELNQIQSWDNEKIFKELTSIQGIGNKTVSIFICFGLKRDSFPIDVHVHRIMTRVGITSNYKNPDKLFKMVNPYIPVGKEFFLHVHLVEHGKGICKSSNPKCESCMFNEYCDYFLKKNAWANHLIEA